MSNIILDWFEAHKNIIVESALFLIILIFFSWSYYFFCTQGTYKFYDVNQGTYYHQLASAFEKGMLGIPGSGPGADWSFYNGVNYLYFGPLPIVIWLFLKNGLHINLSFTQLTLVFSIINLAIFYWLLTLIHKYLFFKKNFYLQKIIFFIIYGLGSLYFLSARYLVYETAIIFGSTFMMISFLFFFAHFNTKGKLIVNDIILLFFSGIALVLSFFSRVNLILALLPFIFFILYKEYSKKNSNILEYTFYKSWFRLTFFLIQILIGIIIYSYYNFARFDNPFEFGTKYSAQQSLEDRFRLTNHENISINYFILNNIQLIGLMPKISLTLPFINYVKPGWLIGEFPKLLNVEWTSSIFFSSPLLLTIIYVPFLILKKFKKKQIITNIFLISSTFASVSIYALFFMGYARRYYQDYYFLLTLLGFIGFSFIWQDYIGKSKQVIKIIFIIGLFCIISWTYLLAVNLNCQLAFKNDYVRCLNIYNKPDTFVPLN